MLICKCCFTLGEDAVASSRSPCFILFRIDTVKAMSGTPAGTSSKGAHSSFGSVSEIVAPNRMQHLVTRAGHMFKLGLVKM